MIRGPRSPTTQPTNMKKTKFLKILISSAIALTVVAVLTPPSCMEIFPSDQTQYDVKNYQGDGRMIDNGDEAAVERFNLILGEVDFSKEQTLIYKLGNLPDVKTMVAGFDLRDLPPLLPDDNGSKNYNLASVGIILKTAEGETIFEKTSPLSTWTWSGNMNGHRRFVYLRDGKPVETSSFEPKPGQQYILTVQIKPLAGSKAVKPAELRVWGGGWKGPQ